jgi:hypothetical protein
MIPLLERMQRNFAENEGEEVDLRISLRSFLILAIPILRLSRYKKSAHSTGEDLYRLIYPDGLWLDEPVRFEHFPVHEFGPYWHIAEKNLVAEIIYLAAHTEFILDPHIVNQDWKQARRMYDPSNKGEYTFQLNEIYSLRVFWYADAFDRQIRAIVGPEETMARYMDTLP